tara:strand:+ start:214 stop:477 length:264 start_codon:yes stop_codon:yes gene_type:complete
VSIETIKNIGYAVSSRTAGTYNISSFTTDGRGTGATFTVTVDSSGAASVSVTGKGNNYVADDRIIIADAQLGGGGAVELTFQVATAS